MHRKTFGWSTEYIPHCIPNKEELLEIFDQYLQKISHYVCDIHMGNNKCKSLGRTLRFLRAIKLRLDNENLSIIPIKDKHRQLWHQHDLKIIFTLSVFLIEAVNLVQNHCGEEELPSLYSCYPLNQNNSLQLKEFDTDQLKKYIWLNASITYEPLLRKYINQVQSNITEDHFQINTSLQRIITHPPQNIKIENYYKTILHDFNCTTQNILKDSPFLNRLYLSVSLALGRLSFIETMSNIDHYIDIKHTNIQEELNYWKTYKQFIQHILPESKTLKPIHFFDLLIEYLEQNIAETNIQTHSPKLIWHNGTLAFAKQFHTLVVNQNMSLNGNFDIEPFVKNIHQFIAIKKDKGEGYLSLHSLLTYFKQLNAEI